MGAQLVAILILPRLYIKDDGSKMVSVGSGIAHVKSASLASAAEFVATSSRHAVAAVMTCLAKKAIATRSKSSVVQRHALEDPLDRFPIGADGQADEVQVVALHRLHCCPVRDVVRGREELLGEHGEA